ncbi:MAG: S-layer homology domain-containing protein [Anaerovoracaceae bacterium]
MKKGLRVLALSLSLALAFSSAVFAAELPADIEGNIYEEAIKTLVENGVVTGDTDGSFHPESNLTRAQACIMIVKAIDPQADLVNGTATQDVQSVADFSDMTGYAWVKNYVNYAVQQGIVKGYPDGTFKPGANVTTNEMLTMVLRASGYTDDKIEGVWPEAHIEKANQIGLMDKMEEDYPATATKGMAAQMVSNQLKDLQAMAPTVEDQPQGTDKDTVSGVPYTKDMKFAKGSFSSDMTAFAGTPFAKDVKIYTYGQESEYSATMEMSTDKNDYREGNLYMYKNVQTSVWYEVTSGKITKMIVPKDTGFSGRAYVVINNKIQSLNGDDEAAPGFETLSASKKITWIGKKTLDCSLYDGNTDGDGQIYELQLSDGMIKNVATPGNGAKGKVFNELTTAKAWTEVAEYKNGVVKLNGGQYIEVKDNATVYVWNDDKEEYQVGKLSSIRSGKDIRAYDISDDDENTADIVVIKDK